MLTTSITAVGRSLVFLEVEAADGSAARGTGYVVARPGLIATAHHIVRDPRRITARPLGGAPLLCEVAAADPRADLAILRALPPPGRAALDPVKLHRGPPVPLGAEVAFMGFPHPDIFDPPLAMAVRGIVGNRYSLGEVEYLVVDAMCAEGMSGGPLFLAGTGEVVATVGSRFDPARTRARLSGVPQAALGAMPRERTNITFATSGRYLGDLLGRC